jgi:hypothetical protein
MLPQRFAFSSFTKTCFFSATHTQFFAVAVAVCAVSKLNTNLFLILHGAQHTLSAAETVQVSYELSEARFSCLLQGRGTSFQDGVAE